MITSYLSPEKNLLYLSLVGPLNRASAAELLHEFDDRLESATARCLLDLSGAEGCDPQGLAVIDRLADRANQERLQFTVSAAASVDAPAIRRRAGVAWTFDSVGSVLA
jgi:ABC-type transporter Mla MlaB component